MQRIRAAIILTLLPGLAVGQGSRSAGPSPPPPDVEVRELEPIHSGAVGRLCPGTDNSLRVILGTTGIGVRQVPVRLALVLPDGPPSGTLIAEGTATLTPGHSGTFTFLHVEIPRRIRGRGAKLVVRANADQEIAEQNLANDVRQIDVDGSTDWSCRR